VIREAPAGPVMVGHFARFNEWTVIDSVEEKPVGPQARRPLCGSGAWKGAATS
jgi:hypothetical protein